MKYVVQALWKNEHAMFRARARPNIVPHKNLVLSMTWTSYLSIWCSSVVAAVIHSGLIKAFPELSWDFTSKIKVGLSLASVGKYRHLAIVWKVTLQDGFSSVTVVHTMAL